LGFELIQITVALLIVLGAIVLLLRFLRQRVLPHSGLIKVFHYQPLGPKKGIAIVKVLNDYLVLGVADENISILSKLNSSDVENTLKHESNIERQASSVERGASGVVRHASSVMRRALKKLVTRYSSLVTGFKVTRYSLLVTFLPIAYSLLPDLSFAAPATPQVGNFLGFATPLDLLLFLTLLSFLPAILVMTTCFMRIVIVLALLRQAMGTPTVPPTQVLIGLALFITLFVMSPVIDRIYSDAYLPYTKQEIGAEEALNRAAVPLKEFMLKQTREKDLALFLNLSNAPRPATPMDLSMRVVIPAFAIGELKRAFEIGFLLFLPFLVIDMVVASVLLSMGMMMLPPIMVSLPFKLLLFVLIDGWGLVIGSLVKSFN
jgi:flagellar biosynthetic protein FliP